jgi:hypothetical protein
MRQSIFLLTELMFIFFSCSTNNKLAEQANGITSNFDSPDNYFKDSSFIDAKLAELMIKDFPKHKYRGWRKNRLKYAWASFSPHLLEEVNKNKNVRITFFLANILKKGDSFRLPTVVMQIKLNSSAVAVNGKGVAYENQFPLTASYIYYGPSSLCPPPTNDCKLAN